MKDNKKISKSIIAVSLSFGFVLILVIALFISGRSKRSENQIQLPDSNSSKQDNSTVQNSSGEELLRVDNQNVITALTSLDRPENYHQTYTVEIGDGENTASTEVEVWVRGFLRQAQIKTQQMNKTVLTDGNNLWVWYSTDLTPVQFQLDKNLTFEDILGLPAFDYLASLESDLITDAEYLILGDESNETSCIFLSILSDEEHVVRYWISLETGLLYEADAMTHDTQVYHVQQTSCDFLAAEDEMFSDKFKLPNGASIMTE